MPREDLTMDFHVRMIDGGALSMVLTRGLAVGAAITRGMGSRVSRSARNHRRREPSAGMDGSDIPAMNSARRVRAGGRPGVAA